MKILLIAILACGLIAAQPPSNPPAVKTCMQFDPNAGHDIPLPCKPSKVKTIAVKVHHALKVGGEIAIGGAIFVVWIYANGRK